MSKVTVPQNTEPGWSNQRSGRGEPQSPATPAAPVPALDDAADPPAPIETETTTARTPARVRKPKAAKKKKRR
jgi:hypothetical protein